MSRVISAIVGVLAMLFGLVLSPGLEPTASADTAQCYTNDSHPARAASTNAASERGPPARYDRATTRDAIDRRSRGASARPGAVQTCAHSIYDIPSSLVHVDNRLGTTPGSAGSASGDLSLFQRDQDAAEDAPELASGIERTGSALAKSDPFHRSVSWVVDNPAAQRFAIKGGDGASRELYQLPGEVNGKSDVFEWIIDRSGSNPVINHQRFIPGGSVTGFPNQVVP